VAHARLELESRQRQASMLCGADLPALPLGSSSKPSPPQLHPVTADLLPPCMDSHLWTSWGPLGASVPLKVKARRDQGGGCFGPGAKVPQKPGDALFDFEPTCIKVAVEGGRDGAGLGNAILDLFRDRRYIDEAAPIRVNEAEMWVQATIFKGLFSCEPRATFYAEGPQACVVDLQCLGGDELVFFWLFQLVKRHLEERGWGILGGDDVAEGFESGPLSLHHGNSWSPRPRGEVAAMVFIPETEDMQAEGALVLARIAEDPVEREHLLSNPQVFGKIRKLLKSDRLEVAWPTARLLEELERVESKPEPLASFLEDLRSEELQAKADSDFTEAAVQNLLRRVFFHKGQGSKRRRVWRDSCKSLRESPRPQQRHRQARSSFCGSARALVQPRAIGPDRKPRKKSLRSSPLQDSAVEGRLGLNAEFAHEALHPREGEGRGKAAGATGKPRPQDRHRAGAGLLFLKTRALVQPRAIAPDRKAARRQGGKKELQEQPASLLQDGRRRPTGRNVGSVQEGLLPLGQLRSPSFFGARGF